MGEILLTERKYFIFLVLHMASKVVVVHLGGAIGAGKSHVLNYLKTQYIYDNGKNRFYGKEDTFMTLASNLWTVHILQEPTDEWRPFLNRFYTAYNTYMAHMITSQGIPPKNNDLLDAFEALQTCIIESYYQKNYEFIEKLKKQPGKHLVITERSGEESKTVFVEPFLRYHDQGTALMMKLDAFYQKCHIHMDGGILLLASLDTLVRRCKNVDFNSSITRAYLDDVHHRSLAFSFQLGYDLVATEGQNNTDKRVEDIVKQIGILLGQYCK